MKNEEINEYVINCFKKNFGEEYEIVKIHEHINSITYIIVEKISGPMCEFSVSKGYSVFDAKSHNLLLSSKYELKRWLQFMQDIESAN